MRQILLGFVGLLALAGLLAAQNPAPLTAEIPFAFYVGNQQMPAGQYCFGLDRDHTYLTKVVPLPRGPGAFFQSFGAGAKRAPDRNMLVFNKYSEDRIFLNQIIHEGDKTASQLSKSKRERESVVSTLRSANRPAELFILAKAR